MNAKEIKQAEDNAVKTILILKEMKSYAENEIKFYERWLIEIKKIKPDVEE